MALSLSQENSFLKNFSWAFPFLPLPATFDSSDFVHQLVSSLTRIFQSQKFAGLVKIVKSRRKRVQVQMSVRQVSVQGEQQQREDAGLLNDVLSLLQQRPQVVLGALRLAIRIIVGERFTADKQVDIRLVNFEPKRKQISLSQDQDRFVVFHAYVVALKKPSFMASSLQLRCFKCRKSRSLHLVDGVFKPQKCGQCQCLMQAQKPSVKVQLKYGYLLFLTKQQLFLQCYSSEKLPTDCLLTVYGILKNCKGPLQAILKQYLSLNNFQCNRAAVAPFVNQDISFPSLLASLAKEVQGFQAVKFAVLITLAGGDVPGMRGWPRTLILDQSKQRIQIILRAATRIGSILKGVKVPCTKQFQATGEHLKENVVVLNVCDLKEIEKCLDSQDKSGVSSGLLAGMVVKGERGKTLLQSLKAHRRVIQRFDLVLSLQDTPDAFQDRKFSQNLLGLASSLQYSQENPPKNFQSHLRSVGREAKVWDESQVRNYISRVKGIQTLLNKEAAQQLRDFFKAIRNNLISKSFTVGTPFMSSLVRFTLARARLDGRTAAVLKDAREVISLFKYCLFSLLNQQCCSRELTKSSMSQQGSRGKRPVGQLSIPKQTKIFIQFLLEESQNKGNRVFDFAQMFAHAKNLGLRVGEFGQFLERLNLEGKLLMKGGRRYQVQGQSV